MAIREYGFQNSNEDFYSNLPFFNIYKKTNKDCYGWYPILRFKYCGEGILLFSSAYKYYADYNQAQANLLENFWKEEVMNKKLPLFQPLIRVIRGKKISVAIDDAQMCEIEPTDALEDWIIAPFIPSEAPAVALTVPTVNNPAHAPTPVPGTEEPLPRRGRKVA